MHETLIHLIEVMKTSFQRQRRNFHRFRSKDCNTHQCTVEHQHLERLQQLTHDEPCLHGSRVSIEWVMSVDLERKMIRPPRQLLERPTGGDRRHLKTSNQLYLREVKVAQLVHHSPNETSEQVVVSTIAVAAADVDVDAVVAAADDDAAAVVAVDESAVDESLRLECSWSWS